MDKELKYFSISVVISTYDTLRKLVRTLDSLKNQSRHDLIKEVLVVNDGSTDDTVALVDKYKSENPILPIKLINKINGGVSTARNAGLQAASGTWIGLCDSDDEWLSQKLEIQYKILENNPDIEFLGGNHTGSQLRILGKKVDCLHKATLKELCIKMFPQTSAVIFKKEIIDAIGGYDESRRYCEDGQFFIKICNKFNYYCHPEKVVEFDGGKPGFGGSGLSGNLKDMQDGLRKNITELWEQKNRYCILCRC